MTRVHWLQAEVYAANGSANLSRTELYRKGLVYGLDAASVFAVECLGVDGTQRVLDLCCAPGAKLCLLADLAQEVLGVDVSEPRLAACRTVLRKYAVTNVRLALGDGTTWTPQAARWFSLEPPARGRSARKRRKQGCEPPAPESFDAVLVDAEPGAIG